MHFTGVWDIHRRIKYHEDENWHRFHGVSVYGLTHTCFARYEALFCTLSSRIFERVGKVDDPFLNDVFIVIDKV